MSKANTPWWLDEQRKNEMTDSELKVRALQFILQISENVLLSDQEMEPLAMDNLDNILTGAQQIYDFLKGETK